MTETTINIIKLTASDGHILTNGKAFGKEVYLGKNDAVDAWWELEEEEALAMQRQREAQEDV